MRWSLVAAVSLGLVAAARAQPTVVLDPGHGGSNTGAAGVIEGLYEKRLTLALARAVARRLEVRGIRVIFTREGDSFVSLRERAKRANVENAALFMSIHANASPSRSQRGFETYVLSPEALSVDTAAIRGADGVARPGLDPETARLCDDLERGAALAASARLADRVQAGLAQVWGMGQNRGVRQAAMDVLMGPTMPAVLVEVGFIDHPVEGVELLRRETRERIAGALAQAILDSPELR